MPRKEKNMSEANDGKTPLLSLKGLTKTYGATTALYPLDLDLSGGKIVGLLGPNGSGKTTLIKMIAGLLVPSEGKILVDGKPVGPETKSLVAYLPERNSLPSSMKVRELVEYFGAFFDDFDCALARKMLEDLGVKPWYVLKNLSKGTKEKVQLVMVMSRRAKVYLLDEPISGVDPAARDYIIRTILTAASPESLVLISTHLIKDIQDALGGFILLKDGRIKSIGTPQGLAAETGKTLDEYFREAFKC